MALRASHWPPFVDEAGLPLLLSTAPRSVETRHHFRQRAVSNGRPKLLHQRLIVMKVVQRTEMSAENLADAVEVVEIGARKVSAGVACATRVKRAWIVLVPGVANPDIAVASE